MCCSRRSRPTLCPGTLGRDQLVNVAVARENLHPQLQCVNNNSRSWRVLEMSVSRPGTEPDTVDEVIDRFRWSPGLEKYAH